MVLPIERKKVSAVDLFTEKYSLLLKNIGILPVICLKNQSELETFVEAILKTNVKCVEITMRHPFSAEAVSYIKKKHPEIVVGAGTVNDLKKLDEAISCGADYLVAPGTLDEILKKASEESVPFLPGCSTPSEIMKLNFMGYKTVKYFPAECSGGTKALKLYEGAFADTMFLPTGGITADNFREYSACKNVLVCGGSFMIPKPMLESGNAEGIAKTISDLIMAFQEVRIK